MSDHMDDNNRFDEELYQQPDSDLYVQRNQLAGADIPRGPDGLPIRERRKRGRSDAVSSAITAVSIIAWVAAIFAIPMFLEAQPKSGINIFTTLLGFKPEPTEWNYGLLKAVFLLLAGAIFLSVLGILFNLIRHKRKSDRYRKNLFIVLGMSIIGLVVFIAFRGFPF